jgi:hypothetical protein
VWRFLKKLKIELTCELVISFLGMYQKEIKSAYKRNICICMCIVALFTIAKLWNQPRCLSVMNG